MALSAVDAEPTMYGEPLAFPAAATTVTPRVEARLTARTARPVDSPVPKSSPSDRLRTSTRSRTARSMARTSTDVSLPPSQPKILYVRIVASGADPGATRNVTPARVAASYGPANV